MSDTKKINIDLVKEFVNAIDGYIEEMVEEVNKVNTVCENASEEVNNSWSLLTEASAVTAKVKSNIPGLLDTLETLKRAVKTYEEMMIEADSAGSISSDFDI